LIKSNERFREQNLCVDSNFRKINQRFERLIGK